VINPPEADKQNFKTLFLARLFPEERGATNPASPEDCMEHSISPMRRTGAISLTSAL